MKLKTLRLDADRISGISTILVVAAFDLWLLISNTDATTSRLALLALLYSIFTISFFINTEDELTLSPWLKLMSVGGQFAVICAVMYNTPNMFSAILLVVWSAQLPYFMSFRWALWLSPIWSILAWSTFYLRWEYEGIVITGVLFYTFNVFALIMMESRRNAEFQKERAEQVNRELIAMQSLVKEASQQEERLRIARDIHDVVGHHLTALTVQLQVLARKAPAALKPEVERSRAISKLLLSDVRAAVSEMREHEQLNLREALEALLANLPDIDVSLAFPDRVAVLNLEQAVAILRGVQESVTNSLRHGKATQIAIEVHQSEHELMVRVRDNGQSNQPIEFGNGLKGMQERLERFNGGLTVERQTRGVEVCLKVPVGL
ncbi:MAG: two component signal transduction system histidine kinase [Idiomarinaceae bacterium HL-53]|nr:MAG: two component signal transduction system histidine kinase [Idiomarinaceae bacterium HL-53]CUS48302.1 Signal transduction histidine kinase [Idiomarinaceae bacterium HL-53]